MKKILRTLSLIRLSFIELKIKKLQSKREKLMIKIVKNANELYNSLLKSYQEEDLL